MRLSAYAETHGLTRLMVYLLWLRTADLKMQFWLGGVIPLRKCTLSLQTPSNLVGSLEFT